MDTFITSPSYGLAEKCMFGNLQDDMIRDRSVVRIKDTVLSDWMQLDDDLTLEKASKMVRQSEQVKQEQRDIGEEKTKQVQVVRQEKDRRRRERLPVGRPQRLHSPSQRPQSTPSRRNVCTRCWRAPYHSRTSCPANKARCH